MFRGLSSLAPGQDGDRSVFGTWAIVTWRSHSQDDEARNNGNREALEVNMCRKIQAVGTAVP